MIMARLKILLNPFVDSNTNFFRNLKEEDKIFPAGPLGNYSLAGFEMVLVFFDIPDYMIWTMDTDNDEDHII